MWHLSSIHRLEWAEGGERQHQHQHSDCSMMNRIPGVGAGNGLLLVLVGGMVLSLASVWVSVSVTEQFAYVVSVANATYSLPELNPYPQAETPTPTPTPTQDEMVGVVESEGGRGDDTGEVGGSLPVLAGNLSAPTLALLYPPGLLGGYRNQAMRFVALCRHAVDHGVAQLLLPSLLWNTRYPHHPGNDYRTFWPVPFEVLFDVDHWNSFHVPGELVGSEVNHTEMTNLINLPFLVSVIAGGDCWRNRSDDDLTNIDSTFPTTQYSHNATANGNSTRRADRFVPPFVAQVLRENVLLTPLADSALDFLLGRVPKLRQFDVSPLVEHCRHPRVYGGGRGAGFLWNDYISMPTRHSHRKQQRRGAEARRNTRLIASMHTALVPAPRWQELARSCVRHYLGDGGGGGSTNNGGGPTTMPGYLVLHARVETEMMTHKCGAGMENNLTTILAMVDDFVQRFNEKQARIVQGAVVAVGREGMQVPVGDPTIDAMARHNWEVLDGRSLSSSNRSRTTSESSTPPSRSSPRRVPIFECGDLWVEREYLPQNEDYGDIIPSMINYWLAVQATAFVGVGKSSWSTDVWTARYYLGRGRSNFEYTAGHGVVPVPNGGMPHPHGSC